MLHTAWILARKDLMLFLRDRTAVLLTFLLPLVLGTIFGTAMSGMAGGGGGGAAPKVELAVEDRDGSEASRELVAALEAAEGLDVTLTSDARRLVANGDQACGLVVPAGYGAGVAAGAPPSLQLLRDPARAISQQVVLFQLAPILLQRQASALGPGLMDRVLALMELEGEGRDEASAVMRDAYSRIDRVMSDLAERGLLDGGPLGGGRVPGETGGAPGDARGGSEAAELARDPGEGSAAAATGASGFDPLAELPRFLGLESEDVAGASDDGIARSAGASHAFASMAVMMLLFSVVGAGGTLLQEKAEGTLTRLQLTPAAGGAVLLGKLASIGIVALAQLVVLFAYGAAAFGVPVLDAPLLLALVSLVWVFLAIGIGILFSVACATQKQLEGLSTLLILVMSAVGGAWFPREITPEWFRTVGSVTPVAWAMDAYHGVLWYGKGLFGSAERSGIWPGVLLMAVTGGVLLALAFRLYRRRFVLSA